MCKLLIITKTDKIKKQKEFIDAALDLVTTSERSGVGYFGVSGNEVIYEKSSDSKMRYSLDRPKYDREYITPDYSTNSTKKHRFTGSMVFHGRTSTNEVSLRNTHPIIKHDWFLSHNGVVNNRGVDYEKITTNDTEHIIEHLAMRGITYLSENLSGYYAVGAISPDKKLWVFRDNIAPLYCGYVKELDAEIFATKAEHVEALADELEVNISRIYKMNSDVFLVFNAITGAFESRGSFKSLGYTYNESRHAQQSLGVTLPEKQSTSVESKPTMYNAQTYSRYNQKTPSLSKAERDFLHFGNNLPHGYEVLDANFNTITKEYYNKLKLDEKLDCVFFDRSIHKGYDLDFFIENKDMNYNFKSE